MPASGEGRRRRPGRRLKHDLPVATWLGRRPAGAWKPALDTLIHFVS